MADDASPLESKIQRLITLAGPMPVAEYMAHCLGDPDHGYYMTQEPLGTAGDFITAPEISQMFGELIGLWAATVWEQMGSAADVRLVELGPGRGTMMQDMLRAARVMPAFRQALSVHLVNDVVAPEELVPATTAVVERVCQMPRDVLIRTKAKALRRAGFDGTSPTLSL